MVKVLVPKTLLKNKKLMKSLSVGDVENEDESEQEFDPESEDSHMDDDDDLPDGVNVDGVSNDLNNSKEFLQQEDVNNLKVDLDISIDAEEGKDGGAMDWSNQVPPAPPDPEAVFN